MAKRNADGLNDQQRRFAEEYLVDLNATKAAIRAGYAEGSAHVAGSDLLINPKVASEIARLQSERSKRTEITADAVLQELWAMGTADAAELVQYRRTCCRFCHGADHLYQYTANEFERHKASVLAANLKKKEGEPKQDIYVGGGIGFNATNAPHPNCSECFGLGIGRSFAADTRTLSPQARKAFAGVKETKDGCEVKIHDKKGPLELVGRHLGLWNDKLDVNITELTDAERMAKLVALADAARARGA